MSTITNPTEAVSSIIVSLYREGQIEEGENLTKWAWANKLPVSLATFANMWEATTTRLVAPEQNPATDRKRLLSALISAHMEKLAERHFGTSLENARQNAMMLSVLSKHARAGQFDRILGKAESITHMVDLYQRTYDLITPLWVTYFAPDALSPFEFECLVYDQTVSTRTTWPKCPGCGKRDHRIDTCFTPDTTATTVSVVTICNVCDFPLTVDIQLA